MARAALPHNMVADSGRVVDAYDTTTTAYLSGGTLSLDTSDYFDGNASLALTIDAGLTSVVITRNEAIDMSGGIAGLNVYFPELTSDTSVVMYISTSGNFATDNMAHAYGGGVFKQGWNFLGAHVDDFNLTPVGSTDLTNITKTKLVISKASGPEVVMKFNGLRAGVRAKGQVTWVMDDGTDTDYTQAYPILTGLGLKGNTALISSLVDTTNFLSLSQAQTMYASGQWGFLNHTDQTAILTSLTGAQVLSTYQNCRDYIAGNALGSGGDILVYPGGARDASVINTVVGDGCRAGLNFASYRDYRGVDTSHSIMDLKRWDINPASNSIAATKAAIDNAGKYGYDLILANHKLVTSGPTGPEMTIADFTTIAQYLQNAVVRGSVKNPTFSEWYNEKEYGRIPVIR